MRFSSWNRCVLVLLLFARTVAFTSTQSDQAEPCDPQCKTGVCDAGVCRCVQPGANIFTFLGGKFCDQPAHYCQGGVDPAFWCLDNDGNSTCALMADGRSTCLCHAGYAGDKCDMVGSICGTGYYCYNNATCVNQVTCDCPSDWRGNANCTLASPIDSGSGGSGIKWWGGLLIAGAVVAAVSAGAVFGVKKYKERREGANRFNELKKSQMRARAESDDEYDSDPYEDEVQAKKSTPTAEP